ncbi:MAG: class I SAM-dependent methyltransferase [Planctomycetota bacterium]
MERLYDDLAWLWPVISPPGDYVEEADRLRAVIEERTGRSAGWSVLELGAGGGHTLVHLADCASRCVAVDLSEPMLANCRELVTGVETVVGDMRDVRLEERFDVVLLHDAVDYMTSSVDAAAAMATVAAHLAPGGVALVAPTYTRETFVDGEVADDGTELPTGGDVTFFSYVYDPDPGDETFEMVLLYLIRGEGDPTDEIRGLRRVEVVEDRHVCGIFSASQWLGWMGEAGLSAEVVEQAGGMSGEAWTLMVGGHAG